MRIRFFGTFDVHTHPRVGVLMEGLAARGHEVTEINEPLGLDTAARVELVRNPTGALAVGARLAATWARLAWRTAGTGGQGRPEVVVVGHLGHLDVHFARLLHPGVPIVLDHMISLADTVADRGIGRPWVRRVLGRLDDAATGAADLVLVDTAASLELVAPADRDRAVVVAVGADAAWLAAGAERTQPAGRGAGPLRVVFFGLFTPLQGAPVIGRALGLLGGVDVEATLCGDGQDREETLRVADGGAPATWTPWVPSADLPSLVAAHDVCLGIVGIGPKTTRVVPTKVFQGAAAGCAVVTGDTPEQRAALGDAAVYVPPGDAPALAAVLTDLAADRERVAQLGAAARFRAAEAFTPAAVVAPLQARLEGLSASPRPAPLTPMATLRADVVERLLGPGDLGDVLEAGAGQGAFATRLASRSRYTGVEPDLESAAMARDRLGAAGRLVEGTAEDLDPDERFDLVCAFEVLEHLADEEAVLRAWIARLRPGGRLLLSVPAHQDRWSVTDELVGHHRRYDPGRLAGLLVEHGLVAAGETVYGMPAGYALEAVRTRLAARRRPEEVGTAGSGRLLQPRSPLLGAVTRAVLAPARLAQRPFGSTSWGTGIVASGRLPLPPAR